MTKKNKTYGFGFVVLVGKKKITKRQPRPLGSVPLAQSPWLRPLGSVPLAQSPWQYMQYLSQLRKVNIFITYIHLWNIFLLSNAYIVYDTEFPIKGLTTNTDVEVGTVMFYSYSR